MNLLRSIFLGIILGLTLALTACVSKPPARLDNICHIFNQYPDWYREARDVERRWHVPVAVQMAIIHQESKFNARAKPGFKHFIWVIPYKRQSTAYGYAQALNGTWDLYKKNSGYKWCLRSNFSNGVDFIGWYANMAYRRAGIPRTDAYLLYLAYHEGVGGYQRKSYLKKPWLIQVARKVNVRSQIYAAQLKQCRKFRG